MPYINIKLYPGRSEEQKQEVARRIAQAVMEVCNVTDPAAIAIAIEDVSPEEYRQTVEPEIQARADSLYFP